ncbi:hypothetical protein QBC39DRAFT_435409 [Podospora conica]|nr:hypothetical protein QBC39DRAFT_435409 [Schizothecium conicum]
MASAEPSPEQGPCTSKSSPLQPKRDSLTSTSSPIAKIPIEILLMIARSITHPDIVKLKMRTSQWAQKDLKKTFTSLPPRPCDLYPLARTCKGFWQCLRPLLFEFDVFFWTELFGDGRSVRRWYPVGTRALTALCWGVTNNNIATIEPALQIARSLGQLEMYTGVSSQLPIPNSRLDLVFGPDHGCTWDVGRFDALFQAVLDDKPELVDILTEHAEASTLNRAWHMDNYVFIEGELRHAENPYMFGDMDMTPLHLAIVLRHKDVAKVLLTRYSQLDPSTLRWYEPTGLHIAAIVGDVDMATLILDGLSPNSPWVARARSQLQDTRAYQCGIDRHWRDPLPPPMVMAAKGMWMPTWRDGGDDIFELLASRGGKHLFTKPFLPVSDGKGFLQFAMQNLTRSMDFTPPTERPGRGMMVPAEETRVLRLVSSGALDIRSLPPPPPPGRAHTHIDPLKWVYNAVGTAEFMGKLWDASLQHYGDLDAQFLAFWEAGISQGNPLPHTRAAPTQANLLREQTRFERVCRKYEHHLAVISLLESKSPGFAQLPAIRAWLDSCVFRRARRGNVSLPDLKGDWSHLI